MHIKAFVMLVAVSSIVIQTWLCSGYPIEAKEKNSV